MSCLYFQKAGAPVCFCTVISMVLSLRPCGLISSTYKTSGFAKSTGQSFSSFELSRTCPTLPEIYQLPATSFLSVLERSPDLSKVFKKVLHEGLLFFRPIQTPHSLPHAHFLPSYLGDHTLGVTVDGTHPTACIPTGI